MYNLVLGKVMIGVDINYLKRRQCLLIIINYCRKFIETIELLAQDSTQTTKTVLQSNVWASPMISFQVEKSDKLMTNVDPSTQATDDACSSRERNRVETFN